MWHIVAEAFICCRCKVLYSVKKVVCLRILNNPATIAVYQRDSQECFSMIIILADINNYAL